MRGEVRNQSNRCAPELGCERDVFDRSESAFHIIEMHGTTPASDRVVPESCRAGEPPPLRTSLAPFSELFLPSSPWDLDVCDMPFLVHKTLRNRWVPVSGIAREGGSKYYR